MKKDSTEKEKEIWVDQRPEALFGGVLNWKGKTESEETEIAQIEKEICRTN